MAIGEADLEREQDIEQLRRIALAQHATIQQMVRSMLRKAREYEFRTGDKSEVQRVLALIEELTKNAETAEATKKPAPPPAKERAPRFSSGPTEQINLLHVPEVFTMDAADRVCPSCGGELHAMDGQFETSE